ncbi:MAG: hypothetical protein KIS72_00260 [Luteimonas sp.]|nr:hypothetical protein [Luteimonas sp.]
MDIRRTFVRGLPLAIVLAWMGASRADGMRGEEAGIAGYACDAVERACGRLPPAVRRVRAPLLAARGGGEPAPERAAGGVADPGGSLHAASTSPALPAQGAAPVVQHTGGRGRRRLHTAAAYLPVPLHSRIDRVQPMTGLVLWNDNADGLAALGDDVQLEFAYFKYSQIVAGGQDYDWSALEARLASAAARGHQMIVRFHDTYPGHTAISIPAHVVESAGYELMYRDVEGRRTFLPDWRSLPLQQFLLEFYTRFAQRYDRDPRLAFVQVGFGSYAEYHLWDGPLALGQTFPSKAYQRQFLEHLGATFAQTPWSVSIDAANPEYTPFRDVPALAQLRFGLFDDSFLHEAHSTSDGEYNRAAWLFFGQQRYRDSPAGGELSYYSDHDQRHALDLPDGPHGRSFESLAAQYHVSYMIGNDQPRYQTRARIRQAAMATGYAFRVSSLASNGSCVRIGVRNEGIAPIYHDAWPAANGRRAAASLKGLAPGDERMFETCPGPHPPGALAITIESDRLVQGQRIQFNADLP